MSASWKGPRSLRRLSAQLVVKTFLKSAKSYMKGREKTDGDPFCAETKMIVFEKLVSDIKLWWTAVTCGSNAFANLFQSSIQEETEEYLLEDETGCDYILHMLMKLILLDEVFLDKDYCAELICKIPFRYEALVSRLITDNVDKFPMTTLTLYGPLYPDITEAILRNSPNLLSLSMSHNVITNDVLRCVGKYCCNLRSFVIIHYNIGNALSREAIIKSFFPGTSESSLKSAYDESQIVPIALPHLQYFDVMGLDFAGYHYDICSWFLFNHKSLRNLTLDWRTNFFGNISLDNDLFEVMLNLINKGMLFNLKDFFIATDVIVSESKIDHLTRSLPLVERLFINCPYRRTSSKHLSACSNLESITKNFKHLNYLYLKCLSESNIMIWIMLPVLTSIGENLRSLTISWENRRSRCNLDIIQLICSTCSSLEVLKLKFDTRCDINYSMLDDEDEHLIFYKLKELSVHEMSPWDTPTVIDEFNIDTRNWIKLMEWFLLCCPALDSLSISVSCPTMGILQILGSSVSTFHLHIKDAFESKIPFETMIGLIKRFPKLRRLFLEEILAEDYWRLKTYFKTTALEISWGNLYGWPRT